MAKGKASGSGHGDAEQEAIQKESTRLRNAAVSRGILSRSKADPCQSRAPSKALLKCDGKDIVKKGNRKCKYLFSFPGLIAPVAGGKFGDLVHLDTRNPILYIDYPQGRFKLFGTIVYSKNKYLTLQISKGTKSVVCDDFFEALVVFSETWWIGKKEDNPEEIKLEMPDSFQQMHTDYDFAAGAGGEKIAETAQKSTLTQTTLAGFQTPSLPEVSTRSSIRLSGQKRNYQEIEISDDENGDQHITHSNTEQVILKMEADEEGKNVKKSKTATILDFMVRKTSNENTTTQASIQKKQATIDSLLKTEGIQQTEK